MEQPHRVRGSRRYYALDGGFAALVRSSGLERVAMQAANRIAQEINASDEKAGTQSGFRARPVSRTVITGWKNRQRRGAAVLMDNYYRAAYGKAISKAVNKQSLGGKRMRPRKRKPRSVK